jgi:oligopeptidase B
MTFLEVSPPTPQLIPGSRRIGKRVVDDSLMWLRDPSSPAPVREYLAAERAFYDANSRTFAPQVSLLAELAHAKIAPEIATPTWTVGARNFRYRWLAGADFSQLYEVLKDGSERPVLDQASLTSTGFIRVADLAISPDGNLIAYTVDTAGTERYELRIRDVESAADIEVIGDPVSYGLVWCKDSLRILYVRADSADRPCEVRVHRVGNPALSDGILFREDDTHFYLELSGSGDGGHAVIHCASRHTMYAHIIDLASEDLTILALRPREDGRRYFAEPVKRETGLHYLILESDTDGKDTLVEYRDQALQAVSRRIDLGGKASRLRSVVHVGDVAVISGRSENLPTIWLLADDSNDSIVIQPPTPNGIFDLDIFSTGDSTELCLKYESKHSAVEWFALSPGDGRMRSLSHNVVNAAVTNGNHAVEDSDYESLVIEIEVRDGTSVPVVITKRKSTPLDGSAPCLLYGYGAWEIVIRPEHSPALLALLDLGFVYAHAYIRGGGEVDHQWWADGSMKSKHHTFDDYCDVARAIGGSIVDASKIVARGLSAGGLLMGAVYGREPELFAGVIAEAPFVDPVTTMSDDSAPLVIIEFDEWGNPARDEDLEWMLSWSPYDNCPPAKTRPPLLTTTAINDPRVSFWEPARWVAKMRSEGESNNILFRVDLGARGHWAPPGRRARIDYETELLGWALYIVDHMDTAAKSHE